MAKAESSPDGSLRADAPGYFERHAADDCPHCGGDGYIPGRHMGKRVSSPCYCSFLRETGPDVFTTEYGRPPPVRR